jgi:hypothetical protein
LLSQFGAKGKVLAGGSDLVAMRFFGFASE